MTLALASWLPLAEKLALQDGRSRRVNHDCGEGRTLKLSREGPALRAYCWRCNDGGIHRVEESLADRILRLNAASANDAALRSEPGVMPEGLTDPSEWPAKARLWFARAGLHSGDIGALRAVYSPATGRVVLPCGGGFWQARALDKGQVPKYLAPLTGKVYPRYGKGERITLTEDILSAYKVGKVGEGWCMLGTSLPSELLAAIISDGRPVNVWLDNDLPPLHLSNRGQIAARKVLAKLRSVGVVARNIVTMQDPKLTKLDEIRKLTS